MVQKRKDNWTIDEDTLLANTVLDYIKSGKTQLLAFQEVGNQLNRTSSACGFRWNSYVRKQYKEEIKIAKHRRKNEKEKNNESLIENTFAESPQINLGDIITFLKDLDQQFVKLKSENVNIKQEYEQIKDEHNELLMLIGKASRLTK